MINVCIHCSHSQATHCYLTMQWRIHDLPTGETDQERAYNGIWAKPQRDPAGGATLKAFYPFYAKEGLKKESPRVPGRLLLAAMNSPHFWSMGADNHLRLSSPGADCNYAAPKSCGIPDIPLSPPFLPPLFSPPPNFRPRSSLRHWVRQCL